MKFFYTALFLVAMSLGVFAQTFTTEDFSNNQMPPAGWSIDNLNGQWSTSATANADGTAPEGMFTWQQIIATSRLVSPTIDLTGYTSVVLRFKHYLDNYGGGAYSIGAATRSGGGDWNVVWEVSPSSSIGPEDLLITVDNSDVGQSDFEFCFFLDGNLYNMNYWYLDDILLFNPANIDGQMASITTYPFVNGPTDVAGVVFNNGLSTITSLEVQWQSNGGEIYTSTFEGLSMEMGDTYAFACDELFNYPIGSYDLHVWISKVNGAPDENPDNDSLNKDISVVSHIVDRVPLLEEFTSSTCAPCASFNTNFVPWCTTNEDDITLVKYQMNWPGSGDPYYTEEGGDRRNYYGVTWVPWLVGNGAFVNTDMGAVNNFFDDAIDIPGFASFVASRSSVSRGTTMDIDVTILPYANFNDFKLQIVVFENLTHNNTGNNGETEFEHVMMKMVPDASGTTLNLEDRVPVTISESVDLAGTNIEEWDDLGVAIIIQDYSTREVYQSGYAVENGVFAIDATLFELNVDGVLVSDFDPDVLDYYVELPEGTTDVPVVTGVATDENATVIVVPATELPGTTTIDVFAEDLQTHVTYSVGFTILTGIGDNQANAVRVYPNPSAGIVNIAGADNSKVTVYNTTGMLVAEYNNFTERTIDLSAQANGIYFIKVSTDSFVITKRITLSH
ncbi:MAG: T9SS type A sorting domain-containing protein [Bacteroidota bacterium]